MRAKATALGLLGLLFLCAWRPALAEGDYTGGCRVNGDQVFHTTPEFAKYLRGAGSASIWLLEFSGHGTRLYQTFEDYQDGRTDNVLWLKDGAWLLLDKSGGQPDPQWFDNLKRALSPKALVYFYGCHTGYYDNSGLVNPRAV